MGRSSGRTAIIYWRPLNEFRDRSVPKLANLARAHAAGLRVPTTCWVAAALEPPAAGLPPPELGSGPWIIRSGSPTEDTKTTSNAGQLLSLPVREQSEFGSALARVREALPRDAAGAVQGAIFVQPLIAAQEAGVAFFDGFYYERTLAHGSNEELTSGQTRGKVTRGHLARGEEWSEWLSALYRVFGVGRHGDARLDLEFARDASGFILLQVRPALFPVARNPILSLANHKEILGDLPSPWIVSALVEAGKDLSFLSRADPVIGTWDEAYAVEVGGRAWLNVSFWYRWMDHFGLPRSLVTEGVGGQTEGPADQRIIGRRFLVSIPRLVWFQLQCLGSLTAVERAFRRLDRSIAAATGLSELHRAMVQGLSLALRGNFAINAVLSAVRRLRSTFRIPGTARVVTQEMMDSYRRLIDLPLAQRAAGLDGWLVRYGHRGPLESDPARPRFAELREVLLADLQQANTTAPSASTAYPSSPGWWRWCYRIDEYREWFRDAMMRRWQRLRAAILAEAQRLTAVGQLACAEDVFWLRASECQACDDLRQRVAANRAANQAIQDVELPQSAPRETIQELLTRTTVARDRESGQEVFPGIALQASVVEGRIVKADDLLALLQAASRDAHLLGPDVILLVPTLEPSWAVVFPRVGGVVADMGGELSHASILLREARRPALVNCAGAYRALQSGDHVRLDGAGAVLRRIGNARST